MELATTDHVWRQFAQRLRAYLLGKVANPADADDVLQEVFIKVHQHLSKLTDTGNLGPWLYRVTKNQLIDFYRKQQRARTAEASAAEALEFTDEEDYHQLLECLNGMVHDLPETYRDAVLRSDMQGLPQQEVANQLGLSLSATKSRVQRGRKLVREHLLRCCRIELAGSGIVVGRLADSTCEYCSTD